MLDDHVKALFQFYGIALFLGAWLGSALHTRLGKTLGWDSRRHYSWLVPVFCALILAAIATIVFWRHVKYIATMQ